MCLSNDVNGPRHANDKNTSSRQPCNSCGFTYSSTIAETIGIPCFEHAFFIPSTRCNSVFVTFVPLPAWSIHMEVFICDNCAKRFNFKILFYFFFWRLNHWLFISRQTQPTRHNPQPQIIKIPWPPKSADHYKHWRQPHKRKMSQSNCSIAIVNSKVLNWKIILFVSRSCISWNTWENWLQGGKCNLPRVYFWLL